MRVFVSVDMEGVSAVEKVHEITPGRPEHDLFCRVMAGDANAVIDGAIRGGATEVVVADGHARMTNIAPGDLDPRARLKSGHSRLVQLKGFSAHFDLMMLVGYHSRSGTQGILSHTFISSFLDLRLDGESVGEAAMNREVAQSFGVPVAFLSGDDVAIAEAAPRLGDIEYVQVKKATSRTTATHFDLARSRSMLSHGACRAMQDARKTSRRKSSKYVEVEIDLSTADGESIPPEAAARNRRFLDSPDDVALSDFDLISRRPTVGPVRDGTIRVHGAVADVYSEIGEIASSLMERNLEWLYREQSAHPYERALDEIFGEAPLLYIR